MPAISYHGTISTKLTSPWHFHLVYTSSPDKTLDPQWTKWVFQRIKELNLHLKLKKCKFGASEIDFLGMILWPGEMAMDPTKLDDIKNWPVPNKLEDLQFFLGFTNYYWKFIDNYSNITRALLDLTKKDKPWSWSPSCQHAFKHLKQCFLPNQYSPSLTTPNPSTPQSMLQEEYFSKQTNGNWHPCSYLSVILHSWMKLWHL